MVSFVHTSGSEETLVVWYPRIPNNHLGTVSGLDFKTVPSFHNAHGENLLTPVHPGKEI
jgi:hypothetical protein